MEYGVATGQSLKLDVRIPSGPGPFPVAIIVHGGGWGGGDKAKDITPFFAPLSAGGFVTFSINYRLAPANRWPACFDDVNTAIRWAKAHAGEYHGDPNRIALLGHSAGGHLVCLAAALATPETRVQAVIGCAPVTDFEQDLAQRNGLSKALQALLDRPQAVTDESRKILHDLSPINNVKPGLYPFLIMQGDADRTVPYQQSLNFQAKLESIGVSCDFFTVKGAPHAVLSWDNFDSSYKTKAVDWLQEVMAK